MWPDDLERVAKQPKCLCCACGRHFGNFRLLFDLRAISVGIIITRCDNLQDIFDDLGRGSSYGMSTTHMSKLLPRIEGGSGAGCPILVIGMKKTLYREEM